MNIRGHWSVLLTPLIPLAFGFYLVSRFNVTPAQTLDKIRHVLSRQPPFEWTIAVDIAVWLVVGFGLLMLAERVIWLATTRVEVMKHGIEHRSGLVRQYTSRIQFKDAECLSLYQSWLGVLLSYGTVTVHGRGSARITLANVATARDLMQHIDRQIARTAETASPGTATPGAPSPLRRTAHEVAMAG